MNEEFGVPDDRGPHFITGFVGSGSRRVSNWVATAQGRYFNMHILFFELRTTKKFVVPWTVRRYPRSLC